MKLSTPIILAMLGLPSIALAGRPGTPDEVYTWVDGATVMSKRPQVCVRFRNTAKVDVGFFVEWSRNGQQFAGKDLYGDKITCGDVSGLGYANSCASRLFHRALGAATRPSEEAKFFCLREFEADSDYCFRFRTFDEDGLWSEYWSPTSCAHTPPTPDQPSAPPRPQLTIIPAETGRGTVGSGQPLRVLLEWGPAPSHQVGEFIIQQRRSASPTWYDVDEQTVGGRFFPNSNKPQAEFEAQIPYLRDPPSDLLRYEFRICAVNWGGRSCSLGRQTPLGLQQEARINAKVSAPGLVTGDRVRAEVLRSPTARVASMPTIGPAANLPNLSGLAEQGAALSAEDAMATALRDRLPDDESRRGFDIAMAAAKGQTEWGPGKQRIHDSLTQAGQIGFKTATSYLFDRNRYAPRAELGAGIAAVDASLEPERMREPDARYWLGFDIATAIFGDPAQGAQGNRAPGPGSMGIRNSLSAPAQRGFDASMKLHLGRSY